MTFRLLAIRNSRKISVIVKSEATVDARGCVIRISAVFRDGRRHRDYIYRRGLLRCLFYDDGQCEKPRIAEQATGKIPHAFVFS